MIVGKRAGKGISGSRARSKLFHSYEPAMVLVELTKLLFVAFAYVGGCFFSALGSSGRRRAEIQAKWLRDCFVRLGPVYVKIGQIIATRSDLIPQEWGNSLKTLQDAAPYMSKTQTLKLVERELARPIDEVFADFDLQPVASASIAQVHRATLLDGRKVAVKLVKRNVRQRLYWNLRLISLIVNSVHSLVRRVHRLQLPKRLD